MADSRNRSKTPGTPRSKPAATDADATQYEGGREAPFSPVSEENSGNSPPVKEASRRADGSTPKGASRTTGRTGTVDAPKAPEITRGKLAAKRKAASAAQPDGRRAQRSRNPHPSR